MSKTISTSGTKLRIIQAATKIFAKNGFNKATISNISREAGLSEGALYEYFKGKEDILISIPDLWISDAKEEIVEQLFGIDGSFNKLRKFLWWFLRYVEKNSGTASVTFLCLKTSKKFLDTKVYSNVKHVYSVLLNIFKEGRESGEMKADLDPYIARAIFLGTIEHIIIRWLLKDMSYSLFDKLDQTFDLLVDAFKKARP